MKIFLSHILMMFGFILIFNMYRLLIRKKYDIYKKTEVRDDQLL